MDITLITNIHACAEFTLRNMPSDTPTKKLILNVIEWAEAEKAKLDAAQPASAETPGDSQG